MADPFIVMYHGGIMPDRGIEALIKVVAINPYLKGIILGNGNEEYIESLHKLVDENGTNNRIIFLPAVPITELWKYVGAVDLSLMMINGHSKSYYFSLPNKFFESIQSLTPIVASDFPEMKKLIDKYGIGLTCKPDDIGKVNECIEYMRTNQFFYRECKHNLTEAKKDLCWENEKRELISALCKIAS